MSLPSREKMKSRAALRTVAGHAWARLRDPALTVAAVAMVLASVLGIGPFATEPAQPMTSLTASLTP